MSTPNHQLPTPKRTRSGRQLSAAASMLLATLGIWVAGVGSSGAQTSAVVLENEQVRVSRNAAPCASAGADCGERIIVALGDIELGPARLRRGELQVFPRSERYQPPQGEFLEVAVKPGRPPVKSPPVLIPPDKNSIVYDGDDFFVFEEKLDPGDTRARHSHRERVVIVINRTRLQQWPDGAPELFRDQVPDDVRFNPPVVHVVKTVGDLPLRNIVIEFKR